MKLQVTIISLFFAFFVCSVQAQDKFISQYKIALNKGFEESIAQKNPTGKEIDFMNYLYRFPILLEDSYTGLSAHIWFRKSWEINFQTLMQYHVNFKNIKLSAMYFPTQNLGYRFGFYRYEQIFTGFYDFPFYENDGSFYVVADKKTKQRVFDKAVYGGIVYRKTINRFQLEGALNGGACIFSPFKVNLFLKKKDSNLLQNIEYQTVSDWYGYILPEISAGYDLFGNAAYNVGIELNASSLITNRAVDFDKTVYSWTSDYYTAVRINPESHLYFRYECDLGIYLKW